MNIEHTYKVLGKQSGPSVAIFAGVHGDEQAGVLALKKLTKMLKITKGTVYLVLANPPAVEQNKRFITKNINRCFYANNQGDTYEDQRARELMKLLDSCDALLDLHAYNNPEGPVFAICDGEATKIAEIFDIPIISNGWNKAEPGGTDGYMYDSGKIGICLECGPISKTSQMADFAYRSVLQFLSYFDMLPEAARLSKTKKKHLKATYSIVVQSDVFEMGTFVNFEPLADNQLIAKEGDKHYTAKAGQCVVFPDPAAPIGHEACIIAEEVAAPDILEAR